MLAMTQNWYRTAVSGSKGYGQCLIHYSGTPLKGHSKIRRTPWLVRATVILVPISVCSEEVPLYSIIDKTLLSLSSDGQV